MRGGMCNVQCAMCKVRGSDKAGMLREGKGKSSEWFAKE